jgi:hypothetical protein
MKTESEIKELKRQWEYDPCWDIEYTEGFEDHRDELTRFHEEMVAIWQFEAEQRVKDKAHQLGVPDNLVLAGYVMNLENRIERITERLDKIEEGWMVYR